MASSPTTRRGAGYCDTPDCPRQGKATFLLNPGTNPFRCPQCLRVGHVVFEAGWVEGKEQALDEGRPLIFRAVSVQFDYDASQRRFAQTAIVTDESIPKWGLTYTMQSPVTSMERTALRLAEHFLGYFRFHLRHWDWASVPERREQQVDLGGTRGDVREQLRLLEWTMGAG